MCYSYCNTSIPSNHITNIIFSGVQIILIGIMGEYLGRIFNESKHRPLYLVNEYNGEKEMNDK